jgi:hypothetical protein
MFTVRRITIGIPLLVISGLAAQSIFSSRVTGNLVSAQWNSSNGSVNITPADTPDGTAYSVFWQGCTLNPDYAHRYCLSAAGLAPRTAIQTQQVDSVGVDVNTSMLSAVFYVNGEDCTSGTCIPFIPASVALNGSFTVYRGPGSYTDESRGTTERVDILPFGGVTSTQTFTGSRTRYSANFAGVVGPITVGAGPGVYNAQVTIMTGQQASQTVYPAP